MQKRKRMIFDLVITALFTAIIIVCSWIAIPLGTVPVTLQTLGVLLTAGLLGFKRGIAAVCAYIVLGAVGLPVFHGFQGGIGVLAGATGGFIFGFVITAFVVGFTVEKFGAEFKYLIIAMCIGVLLCYLSGTLWYMCFYNDGKGFFSVVLTTVVPFLAFDAVKIVLALFLVKRVRKNTEFK